eukprot:gene11442-23932_t
MIENCDLRKKYTFTNLPQERKRAPDNDNVLYPPFPEIIVKLLSSSSLCFLSTTDGVGNPHLSLMSFTYYVDQNKQEVLLITTREDTQKFAHIQECPAVAVLIHDFPHLKGQESRNGEKTASITLKGFASIENSLKQEEFRAIHLQKNLEYKQFIVGENIRVISIRIESARICDFQDQ